MPGGLPPEADHPAPCMPQPVPLNRILETKA